MNHQIRKTSNLCSALLRTRSCKLRLRSSILLETFVAECGFPTMHSGHTENDAYLRRDMINDEILLRQFDSE